jgi:hypothetical protein
LNFHFENTRDADFHGKARSFFRVSATFSRLEGQIFLLSAPLISFSVRFLKHETRISFIQQKHSISISLKWNADMIQQVKGLTTIQSMHNKFQQKTLAVCEICAIQLQSLQISASQL